MLNFLVLALRPFGYDGPALKVPRALAALSSRFLFVIHGFVVRLAT